ncbi:DNA (cytosine-5-)-methyltransferase [[Limnothrix rosea] IAM M-220]|uniref:DNA (cytosine-5-)-methyltransferase n=1 Tax=[Limnothrix rosea] IAM M-220 TaxID=454133 RepID=UPI000959D413|nr:DNA (cytosine-5-)-methyltransferase [[Limnothrix rosea] IAM M-220]OKH17801.1 DNA (cytosine-5-)-methyltransferase [[Limnothrix rosea] IAM M-220]
MNKTFHNPVYEYYSAAQVADILGISKCTLSKWHRSGKLIPDQYESQRKGMPQYHIEHLKYFDVFQQLLSSQWNQELAIKPCRAYQSVELFAGAGGLAIGLEKAGFNGILFNEIDKNACKTLRHNRPSWNVIEDDISQVDFFDYKNKVDILSGGFPCQAFSYAGKKLGFEDTRGTLFFEFARAVREINPKIFLAENVAGLLKHDDGKTLSTIKNVIQELGYELIEPRVLKAIFYKVPQKRERLFLIAIRKDLGSVTQFKWPDPYYKLMTVRDALKGGSLYSSEVSESVGQTYSQRKAEILSHVPEGGYWRDLPDHLQREYMKKSYFLGGGKTGIARRLAWDEPSLTLTCAPAQKQTERCHPQETRPLTVREYARIQTFPDEWKFIGSISSQYRQIGNAVPVNLAYAVGRSLVRLLNEIEHPVSMQTLSEQKNSAKTKTPTCKQLELTF